VVDRHEFCPFHPEAIVEAYRQDSPLRKPRPGMITQAAEKLALDLSRSWTIGDAPRDVEAGHAAGCRTILVKDPSLPPSPAANSASDVEPGFVVGSLRGAIDVIARETMGAAATEEAAPGTEVTRAEEEAEREAEALEAATMKLAPAVTAAPPPADAPRSEATRSESGASSVLHNTGAGMSQNTPPPAAGAASVGRLEDLTEQVLSELRRQNEPVVPDFSVSKLMAGIVQVIALAALFMAYFRDGNAQLATLLTALTLQCFTISLLIMGRQK
jgi:hypothetical protein